MIYILGYFKTYKSEGIGNTSKWSSYMANPMFKELISFVNLKNNPT